jgi:hypothetical protein
MTALEILRRVFLGTVGLVGAAVAGLLGTRAYTSLVFPIYSDVGVNNVVVGSWALPLGLLTYATISLGLLLGAARLSRSRWQSAYNCGGPFILLGAGLFCALMQVAFR